MIGGKHKKSQNEMLLGGNLIVNLLEIILLSNLRVRKKWENSPVLHME